MELSGIKRKNKKAQMGHALTWLHKFFILVVVMGGVIFVILAHYSKQYDVRDYEASILARKIAECIAPEGKIQEFNREEVINCFPIDDRELYINITLKNSKKSIAIGDNLIATLCEVMESKQSRVKHYPSCLEETYHVIKDKESEQMDIFIGIKKTEKNI